MRRFLSVVSLVAALIGLGGLAATPAAADDYKTCTDSGTVDDNVRMGACNRAIASRKYKGSWLAVCYSARGFVYTNWRQYDRALQELNESIRLYAGNGVAWSNRGNAHAGLGDHDRAIMDYNEAIRLNPKDALHYSNRATSYEAKGELEKALVDFRVSYNLNSGLSWASEGLRRVEQALAARVATRAPPPPPPPPVTPPPPPVDRNAEMRRDYELAAQVGTKEAWEAFLARYSTGFYADLARAQLAARAAAVTPAVPQPSVPRVAPGADFGRRVALVIGNGAYSTVASLANPRRDAEAIASALRGAGFQTVKLETDLGREKFMSTLRAFVREAEQADWAAVYFAGHGIELNGINYLIPVDAKLESDRDVDFEAVPLTHVLNAVNGAKKLRLVLLDACRDNPFARQMRRTVASRSIGRGLARVEPDAGTLVVYAAKDGEIALDGEGANSPFATAFMRTLAKPGVEIRKFFDVVRDDVLAATSRRQQPFTYGSLPGSEDFFFVMR